MVTANRYHDICCGHRVYGHENKCANLHGHNYRFEFYVEPYPIGELDKIGRVMDFALINKLLCGWLEEYWDHKFLIWEEDPLSNVKVLLDSVGGEIENLEKSFVIVPFNPTAENIAAYFVEVIAPDLLKGTGTRLNKLVLWETRKCSVTYAL